MKRILIALLVTTTACAAEEPVGYGEGLGTPEDPIPREDAYSVVSRLDFRGDMIEFQAALADLRSFSQNPARALLARAQAENDPALQTLYSALSTTLRDRLEGWINAELDKVVVSAGKTLRQYGVEMNAIAETSLTQFTLNSSLTISPEQVVHQLLNLNFRPVALDILIPIGGLKADTLTHYTTATVAEGGALTLGDHKFSLAFGTHAWQGINLASTTLFGADVPTTLTRIDCRALAQAVATKCVYTSCVGNATQLEAVCKNSVSAVIDELRTRVSGFNLEVFRYVSGNARLVDDNGDGNADKIVDGTWDVQLDLGSGVHGATGTFLTLGR